MKVFIFGMGLMTCLVATNLFADDAKFQERKAQALKRVEERMAKIAEMKSCIESATEGKALKECHEKMKAWNEAHKAEKNKEHKE